MFSSVFHFPTIKSEEGMTFGTSWKRKRMFYKNEKEVY